MKWVLFIFLGLYGVALLLLLMGTFGWFGQSEDPLSAIFLVPLGLPWNILLDRAAGIGGLGTLLLTPAVNAAILYWLWKR